MNEKDKFSGARELLQTQSFGLLSTQSVHTPGYPFGSVTPYVLDQRSRPFILISSIAEHTKNIQANPKVSLTVLADYAQGDVQAAARLTYLADAMLLDATKEDSDILEATADKYYRYFPHSQGYHQTHDFNFYRLEGVQTRFIGGFGQMYWADARAMGEVSPFSFAEEKKIIEHMNHDHADALKTFCKFFKAFDANQSTMVGINGDGFDILTEKGRLRFQFDEKVTDSNSARQALIRLVQKARQPKSESPNF